VQTVQYIQIGFAALKDQFECSFLRQQRGEITSVEHDIRLSHCGDALFQGLEFVQIEKGKSLDCLIEDVVYDLIDCHVYSNRECIILSATSEEETL
jgi:hypothetical protein